MATASDKIVVITDAETFRTEDVEKHFKSFNYVAVDAEFIGRTLSLLQIATPEKSVFLLDITRLGKIIEPFKKILTSSDTIKLIHQILKSRENKWAIHNKPPGLKTLCKEYVVPMNSELKDKVKMSLKQGKAYFSPRNTDGSLPDEMKEYAAQDVTVLIDLYNRMESLFGEDMKPLYNRLVDVALYADLDGVDNRRFYQRDKSLLGMVATPQLLAEFDAGPNMQNEKDLLRNEGRRSQRLS